MIARQVLIRVRLAGIGGALALGVAACVAPPRIVGQTHAPIAPSQVMVFESPFIPEHYSVVAKLDATGYGYSGGMDNFVLHRLRREAARLGANGVLLIKIGHSYRLIRWGTVSPPVKAEAIYVPR